MERFGSFGWVGLAVLLGFAGPGASLAECGPAEDANRASYRQLAWADFARARGFEIGPTEAAVSAEIATSVALDEWQLRVTRNAAGAPIARIGALCVRAYMHKDRSGRASQRGREDLAHEQGHFDIAQLFAGVLRARLEQISLEVASESEAREETLREIRAVYRATMAEFQTMQARYEEQTAFGNKRGRQVRWQRDLALRLAQQEALRGQEDASVLCVR
jgi:hypothetical protein